MPQIHALEYSSTVFNSLVPPHLLHMEAVWHWIPLKTAFSAICQFHFLLKGRDFILFTDHKPLTDALFRTTPPWSTHQQRQFSFISEFMSNIVNLPGVENCIANGLVLPSSAHPSSASTASKKVQTSPSLLSPALLPEVHLSTPEFEFSALPPLQLSFSSVQAMLANSSLQVMSIPYGDSTVLCCDVSSSSVHTLLPTSLPKQLFSALHGISHPGFQDLGD